MQSYTASQSRDMEWTKLQSTERRVCDLEIKDSTPGGAPVRSRPFLG